MKEHFNKEIGKLKKMVSAQASAVETIISRAVESVDNLNCELAAQVAAGDSIIDLEEINIEEECLKLLALYQPVASDLRTVIALLKINTCLERIADSAVHISKRLPILASCTNCPNLQLIDFKEMEQQVLEMLRKSMQVMQSGDIILAYNIIEKDDEIDERHASNIVRIGELIKRSPDNVCYYLQAQGVSRDLERIADLTANICEHIVYLETGKIIRHSGIPSTS